MVAQDTRTEALGSFAEAPIDARDIDLGLALAQLLEAVNLVISGEDGTEVRRQLRERRDFAVRIIKRWTDPRMPAPVLRLVPSADEPQGVA